MSKLEKMTAKDAKEYLLRLDKRAKERQAAYLKKKVEAGMRRISTYISPEAGAALDELMAESGRNINETISAALISAARHLNHGASPARRIPHKTPPETETMILELANSGMGPQAIANRLNAAGIQTPSGATWERGSIARIIKRVSGAG